MVLVVDGNVVYHGGAR